MESLQVATSRRQGTAPRLRPAPFALLLALGAAALPPGVTQAQTAPPASQAAATCGSAGEWIAPATRERHADPYSAALRAAVVLLGEEHDSAEHHRWQLHTLAVLHSRRPDMVIGFEMFTRRFQPVLDRWVAGELSEVAFLEEVDWRNNWGMDPGLYLPLFHFARMHRLPMVALNIERAVTRRVSREGIAAVPQDEREGVSLPEPPSAAYRASLERVFGQHGPGGATERFIDAQVLWDRAMAEVLADAHRRPGAPLAVGIMGHGHVERGHGVPHQLSALGVGPVVGLMPWSARRACRDLPADLAEAVFLVAPPREPARPAPLRLGVRLQQEQGGARVMAVDPDSVGAIAGLQAGDLLVAAAGKSVATPADVTATLARQAPGTWLPLRIERAGAMVEIVARFAPAP